MRFEISAGRVLGSRYRLDNPIKPGGMGMVWQAYDQRLGRPVAVKFMVPDGMMTPQRRREMLRRFQQEAAVTARFTHVGVPAVHDLGEEDGYFYLVLELVTGMSLDDLREESGVLELPIAASVIVPLCDVLSEAHREGIVHRDVKPENVMVSERGDTKLLDFGIARVPGELGDSRLTRTGSAVGTPLYMSPEQFNREEATGRSDLYNLGMLLYEMLTGQRVIDQEQDLWERQSSGRSTHAPLDALTVGLPSAVLELADRLLAVDPAARPATADEVNSVLRPYLPAPGDPPPVEFMTCDPTRPFRALFAPEEHRAHAVARPGSTPRTFRLRTDARDLHRDARRLLTEEPAKVIDLLTERLPAFERQYGLRATEVLDLRIDLATALFARGDGRARAVCEEILRDTDGIEVLTLYHQQAQALLSSED
ncbi:serine/threonine-protein kinase [Streptomyces sp. NPDC093252]|uniref:serine/threonine-protein kinase n=1 Tax=Streptomyces sp. NPDC093252 TaxID=3154980 RepID=UPI00343539E9